MPKLLPVVSLMSGNFSNFLQGDGICIELDSTEWFEYLRTYKSFSVEINNKRFTVIKKLTKNGFTYWNLKYWNPRLAKNVYVYLGKTDQLTGKKLSEIVIDKMIYEFYHLIQSKQ